MESKFGTKKSTIPLSKYMSLVVMFFVVSVLNNYALNFNISMPLHMIFRSVRFYIFHLASFLLILFELTQ